MSHIIEIICLVCVRFTRERISDKYELDSKCLDTHVLDCIDHWGPKYSPRESLNEEDDLTFICQNCKKMQ